MPPLNKELSSKPNEWRVGYTTDIKGELVKIRCARDWRWRFFAEVIESEYHTDACDRLERYCGVDHNLEFSYITVIHKGVRMRQFTFYDNNNELFSQNRGNGLLNDLVYDVLRGVKAMKPEKSVTTWDSGDGSYDGWGV